MTKPTTIIGKSNPTFLNAADPDGHEAKLIGKGHGWAVYEYPRTPPENSIFRIWYDNGAVNVIHPGMAEATLEATKTVQKALRPRGWSVKIVSKNGYISWVSVDEVNLTSRKKERRVWESRTQAVMHVWRLRALFEAAGDNEKKVKLVKV